MSRDTREKGRDPQAPAQQDGPSQKQAVPPGKATLTARIDRDSPVQRKAGPARPPAPATTTAVASPVRSSAA